jgi:hypothetical protein
MAGGLPIGERDKSLDRHKLVEGLGQIVGFVLEVGQVRQIERRFLRVKIAGDRLGDML